MTRTLVFIGTHKEEASFGHHLKRYMLENMPALTVDDPKLFGHDTILFHSNRYSCHNEAHGQTVGSRNRADRHIVETAAAYLPDITIDVHTTPADMKIPNRLSEDQWYKRCPCFTYEPFFATCDHSQQSHIHFDALSEHDLVRAQGLPGLVNACKRGSTILSLERYPSRYEPLTSKLPVIPTSFYWLEVLIHSSETPPFTYSAEMAAELLAELHLTWQKIKDRTPEPKPEVPEEDDIPF